MAEPTPFDGLFHAEHNAARRFAGTRWDFPRKDLNESARALFARLDDVFTRLAAPGYVFLSTIELDAEAGRFPDMLAEFFRGGIQRDLGCYYVAALRRTVAGGVGSGRLTFQAAAGQTAHLLVQNGGFRWGSQLRVWGLQVPESAVSDVIDLSPYEPLAANTLQSTARAAWLATDDLDALALWFSPSVDESVRRSV